MIDTNIYITYVTCVTYVTYDYVHTLQQIIIINSGIHLFSSPGSQNILLATDVEKSPFPRNAPTSFSFACRCFVLCAALLLINSANLTLTVPSHRINLKHIGNECLSPHGSARCIFTAFCIQVVLLPDPGVSGVRSMGPGLSMSLQDLWLRLC